MKSSSKDDASLGEQGSVGEEGSYRGVCPPSVASSSVPEGLAGKAEGMTNADQKMFAKMKRSKMGCDPKTLLLEETKAGE